jgi:hypothetical protein
MKSYVKGGFVALSTLAGSAFAAVPADVTTALESAKTDGVQVAGVVLTVVIAIAAFKYIRRAL